MSEKTPLVRLLHRRVACENSRWTICFDHIQGSHGAEVKDFLVFNPKVVGAGFIAGVTVVPIWEGKVILLRSFRHLFQDFVWELPGGFIDEEKEKPEVAALRELEEETGYTCRPEDLLGLGQVMPIPSSVRGKTAIFLARSCRSGNALDTTEPGLGSCHAVDLDRVRALLDRFEIEDAVAQVALRHALDLLCG